MVFGNGYGGEEGGPVIEQTSSSPTHYEIMALVRLLASGLGVCPDGEEEAPYLLQIKDSLAEIKDLLEQSHNASEAIRAEAQAILEAHAESAQEYIQQVEQPESSDFHPFVTMPDGTTVRDLPDGGRIFTLADGVIVRANVDGVLVSVSQDGTAVTLEPARGGIVTLPDGRELILKPEAIRVTHEAAAIEGLPLDIDPVQTAEGRYRVELPGGYRLDVSHYDRTAVLGNPDGTVEPRASSPREAATRGLSKPTARSICPWRTAWISLSVSRNPPETMKNPVPAESPRSSARSVNDGA